MKLLSGFLAVQRQKKIKSYIRGDVLDLGCGNAQVFTSYGAMISSYCGVERFDKVTERLKLQYPAADFFQRNLDCEQLKTDRMFDCVLMIAVIEHLFNQRFVMDEISKVLRPGGIVVITTPTPFGNDVVLRLGAAVGLFDKSQADDHIVIYNRHRFSILAKEVGLKLRSHRYFQLYCNQIAVLEKPFDNEPDV